MTMDHTIRAFDEELQDLTGQVSDMGRIAAALLDKSVNALIGNDATLADEVVKPIFNSMRCREPLRRRPCKLLPAGNPSLTT